MVEMWPAVIALFLPTFSDPFLNRSAGILLRSATLTSPFSFLAMLGRG